MNATGAKCPHCERARVPPNVTCTRSQCQEAEYHARKKVPAKKSDGGVHQTPRKTIKVAIRRAGEAREWEQAAAWEGVSLAEFTRRALNARAEGQLTAGKGGR